MEATFESLIAGLPGAELVQAPASSIGDIVHDSRDVRPGSCFVCRRGLRVDGHDYVPAALAAGAAAIVAERPIETPAGTLAWRSCPMVAWRWPTWRAGSGASRIAGWDLIGVTGTDGKTSTSRLIAWMLGAYVAGVGELTTVNTRAGGADLKKSGRLTTP